MAEFGPESFKLREKKTVSLVNAKSSDKIDSKNGKIEESAKVSVL